MMPRYLQVGFIFNIFEFKENWKHCILKSFVLFDLDLPLIHLHLTIFRADKSFVMSSTVHLVMVK